MRFIGFARQHFQAASVHRQGAGERQSLFAFFQRLQVRHEHFIGHDRAGAQHLRATDGDAFAVLVDDGRHQILAAVELVLLAPVFGAVGLRVGDDVGQEQIVVTGVMEVVVQRAGALLTVLAKHLDAHVLTGQCAGHMVGRAAHEAMMLFGPGHQRLAPLHQLFVAARLFPAAIDAPAIADIEGHQFLMIGVGLEVIQRAGGLHRIAKGRMLGDVARQLAVDVDRAPILDGLQMPFAVLDAHAVLLEP